MPFLFCLLFLTFFSAIPVSAQQECIRWDVSGEWNIKVKSGPRKGYVARASLKTSGQNLSGRVTDGGRSTGTVKNGRFDGYKFDLYVLWDGTSADGSNAEVFVGKIDSNGVIEGTALLIGDRSQNATWTSEKPMRCTSYIEVEKPPKTPWITASAAVFGPNSTSGFSILKWDAGAERPDAKVWLTVDDGERTLFGNMRAGALQITAERNKKYLYTLMAGAETLGTATVGSAPQTPNIAATQPHFPPYSAIGFVILSWDAGKDHPYAEVWYRINNSDEIFLVEQGKGSQQMPVERGKYYTYILTDSGKTLATVTVVGQ